MAMTCQKTVWMVLPTVETAPMAIDGDERHEQSVLEQILAVFRAAESCDDPQRGDG